MQPAVFVQSSSQVTRQQLHNSWAKAVIFDHAFRTHFFPSNFRCALRPTCAEKVWYMPACQPRFLCDFAISASTAKNSFGAGDGTQEMAAGLLPVEAPKASSWAVLPGCDQSSERAEIYALLYCLASLGVILQYIPIA